MSDIENELTLEEAYKIVKKLITERDAKILADLQWMSANTSQTAGATEDLTKLRNEKFMQRNQVLFSVGYLDKVEFKYSDIETFIRQRFPISNSGSVLNVAHAMSELAGDTGILKRTPGGDGYMLKAPIFINCLRSMLKCAEGNEVVEKVVISVS